MRAAAVAVAPIRRAPPLVVGAALVCATLATGCAAHRRPETVADHFVRRGEPTVDLGGKPSKTSTAEYVAQLRKLAVEAHPRSKSTVPEVAESRDERLREALGRLQAAPTAESHREVAIEYRRLRISDAAYSHLSAAIRLAPKDASSYDLRARLWRSWGLPELGLPDARRAVALAPHSASAWNTLGLLLEASRRPDEGIQAYLRAVVLEDSAGYAWSNLCRVWVTRRDGGSAIQACRRAVTLTPTDTAIAANLLAAERLVAPARRPPGGSVSVETLSADRGHEATQAVTRRSPPVHY